MRLANRANRWRGRRGAAPRRYASAYTWPPVIDRFLTLYREALAERAATLHGPD